jgi:hypothetical protein
VKLLRKAYRTTEQSLSSLSWQLDGLELNKTALDTVEAKKLAQRLREVTGQTDYYFSQDVRVTARLLAYLLAFESHQQGFGLTATQDAHFNEVSLRPMFPIPWPWPLAPCFLAPQLPSSPDLVLKLKPLHSGEMRVLGFSSFLVLSSPGSLFLGFPLNTWTDLSCLLCPFIHPHQVANPNSYLHLSRICCGPALHCLLQRQGTYGKHWGSGPPGAPQAVQGWCGIWRNMQPPWRGIWNSHT